MLKFCGQMKLKVFVNYLQMNQNSKRLTNFSCQLVCSSDVRHDMPKQSKQLKNGKWLVDFVKKLLNATSKPIFDQNRNRRLFYSRLFCREFFALSYKRAPIRDTSLRSVWKTRFFAIFTSFSTVAPPVGFVDTFGQHIRNLQKISEILSHYTAL